MNRSLVRAAVSTLAAAALTLAFLAVPASSPSQAASFTFTDAGCGSFGITDNGSGSFTLTCQSLNCSIAATKANPLPTDLETLTATCAGADANTTYTWTAGGSNNANCPSMTPSTNTAALVAPGVAVSGCVYKVAAADGGNGNGSAQISLTYSTATNPPSSCTLTSSPQSLSAAGNVTLTMTCTGGDAVTSVNWTGGAFGTGSSTSCSSPCQNTTNISATTSFSATASNAAGNGPTKSVSVTVGGGGGGAVDTSACSALGLTPHVITMPWGVNALAYTVDSGGFGPNDAIVVKFTTSAITTSVKGGSFNAVEYADPLAPRNGSLSAIPCDFTNGMPLVGGNFSVFANDTAPSSLFSLTAKTGKALLSPSTTYYINIRNASCPSGSCNMQITVNKPSDD
jgi:hypothetical protein